MAGFPGEKGRGTLPLVTQQGSEHRGGPPSHFTWVPTWLPHLVLGWSVGPQDRWWQPVACGPRCKLEPHLFGRPTLSCMASRKHCVRGRPPHSVQLRLCAFGKGKTYKWSQALLSGSSLSLPPRNIPYPSLWLDFWSLRMDPQHRVCFLSSDLHVGLEAGTLQSTWHL